MKADTTMAGIYTDLQGFGTMKMAAREKTDDAIRAVAGQFEALFVQTMLKSMRDASLGDGLFDSSQSRMYQDLFDKQLSLDLSAQGQFGFSEMLVRQLGSEQDAVEQQQEPQTGFPFTPAADGRVFTGVVRQPYELQQTGRRIAAPISIEKQPATTDEVSEKGFASRREFIEKLYPYAQQAADKLGVKPEVLLAQAALETGWGRHVMQHANGHSSHNLFGIKAGQDWQGDRIAVNSLEYEQGVARKHLSVFRAYDSYASSFADYAEFVSSRPRYQNAINNAQDPGAYLHALQAAGYATDPRYAEKIISILQRQEFSSEIPEHMRLGKGLTELNEG